MIAMNTSILLLTVALTTGQPAERGLATFAATDAGARTRYSGIYDDESLIPNAHSISAYRLDTHLLVLDAPARDWHVAMMTGLSLNDAKAGDKKPLGPTMRFAWSRGASIFRNACASGEEAREIPIDGPATLEFGYFVPTPLTKVGRISPGTRATRVCRRSAGGSSAPRRAAARASSSGVKQSDDWERGRADKAAAWRRDTI